MKFSMKCTCGHVVTVDADNMEGAVEKIQGIMTEDAIAAHMAEKHAGEPVPSKEQSDANIAKMTYQEGAAAAM